MKSKLFCMGMAAVALLAFVSWAQAGDLAYTTGDGCAQACDSDPCCDPCGCDECCCTPECWRGFSVCTDPGIVFGAEAVFLKPYVNSFTDLGFSIGQASVDFPLRENRYDVTPRVWLGYVWEHGFGVRARYWQFNQPLVAEAYDVNFGGVNVATTGRLNMYAVDIEATQQANFGFWDLTFAGGVRLGSIRHCNTLHVAGLIADDIDAFWCSKFDKAVGPTVAIEFERPIGSRGLALVGKARGSLLFGSNTTEVGLPHAIRTPEFAVGQFTLPALTIPPVGAYVKQDVVMGVLEVQLGGEWTRKLDNGAEFFVSALWEAQLWSGDRSLLGVKDDIGMIGGSFGAGISR